MAVPIRNYILLVAMMFASSLALVLHPTPKLVDKSLELDLENMIPKEFNDWRIDDSIPQVLPNPELLRTLRDTYSQTLSRTYINKNGQRLMLAIAYGGTGKAMQYHRPDVCYPAQGFEVISKSHGILDTPLGSIPINRLYAKLRDRDEPVTYWVTMGGKRTEYGLAMRLAQLKYGLTGVIPEGMLVRFSSIGSDVPKEYTTQDEFAKKMIQSMKPLDAARLTGF
jgi:EpsI family protein